MPHVSNAPRWIPERLRALARNEVVWFLLILLLLLFALTIRIQLAQYGMPEAPIADRSFVTLRADEDFTTGRAIEMVRNRTLDSGFHVYGALFYYILALVVLGVYKGSTFLGTALSLDQIHLSAFYYWTRVVTGLAGTVSIAVTAAIAWRFLKSRAVAAGTTAFLAVCFLHAQSSSETRVDIYMTLFEILAVYMACAALVKGPQWRYYLLAALFAGCALACKLPGGAAVFPCLAAHVFLWRQNKITLFAPRLFAACVVVPLVYLILDPFLLLKTRDVLASYTIIHDAYISARPERTYSYVENFAYLKRGVGIELLGLAAIGALVMLWRAPALAITLFLAPSITFAVMGYFPNPHQSTITVTTCFIALYAAYALLAPAEVLFNAFRSSNKHIPRIFAGLAAATLVIVSLLLFGKMARAELQFARNAGGPSTLWQARTWVDARVPFGAHIAFDFYGPSLDESRYYLSALSFAGLSKDWLQWQNFDCIITVPAQYNELRAHPDLHAKELQKYDSLAKECELVARFVPGSETGLSGPEILIYRPSQAVSYIEPKAPALTRMSVANGDFEQWSNGIPIAWTPQRWLGPGSLSSVSMEPARGVSLRWAQVDTYGLVVQRIPIDSSVLGKRLRFSADVWATGGRPQILLREGDSRGPCPYYRESTTCTHVGQWETLSVELPISKKLYGDAFVQIELVRSAGNSGEVVLFDHVRYDGYENE